MSCPRCGKVAIINKTYPFCDDCQKNFDLMVEELRLAYIHQRFHPHKKLLWINIEQDVKGKLQIK